MRSMLRFTLAQGSWRIPFLWGTGLFLILLRLVPPAQIGALTVLFNTGRPAEELWPGVYRALSFLIAAQLAVSFLSFWQCRNQYVFQEKVAYSLIIDLYHHLLRLSARFFSDRNSDALNTRALEDSRIVAEFWSQAVVSVPLAVCSLLVIGGYMFMRNWFLALCVIPLVLLSGYFVLFDRKIQKTFRELRQTWDQVKGRTTEMVGAVDELRRQAALDYGLDSIRTEVAHYRRNMTEVGRLSAIFEAVGPFVSTLQSVALYWLGAAMCLRASWLSGLGATLSWGDVIQFMLLAGLFSQPVTQVVNFILRWRMSLESSQRIGEILNQPIAYKVSPDGSPDLPLPAQGRVEFTDVRVVAPSGAPILDGINAVVSAGSHIGLVGEAGCGKTTLIDLITRGVDAARGHVTLDGRDVAEYDLLSLARRVALVPQRPVLLEGSLRNNILLGLRRPSPRSEQDETGLLDIDVLAGANGSVNLDAELLTVVRQACLEDDVLRKGLLARLPLSPKFDAIRAGIDQLRRQVRTLLEPQKECLIPFDAKTFLAEGTVIENLLGPGASLAEVDEGHRQRLEGCLKSVGLASDLSVLALRRAIGDQTLMVRLSQSPEIVRMALDIGTDGPPLVLSAEHDWPAATRRALLELSLEMDAVQALKLVPEADAFRDKVIKARTMLLAAGAGEWPATASYSERLTLRENLLCGRPNRNWFRSDAQAEGAMRAALIDCKLLDTVVLAGLEQRISRGGQGLSGGQRQKVALARALLKQPALLLLDEVTANLDELSQTAIVELLRQKLGSRTVIAISHRLAMVRDFDQVLVLDRGQIVQAGTYDELAAQPGTFHNLLGARSDVPLVTSAPVSDDRLEQLLGRSPLFAQLTGAELRPLAADMRLTECPAGTVLFRRGDTGDELFVILAGEVEFFADVQEKEGAVTEIVDRFGPGQTFGELALLGAGRRTLSARARTDLRLGTLSRTEWLHALTVHPTLALQVLETLARRLASLMDRIYVSPAKPPIA